MAAQPPPRGATRIRRPLVLLLLLALLSALLSSCSSGGEQEGLAAPLAPAPRSSTAPGSDGGVPSKDAFLDPQGDYFGVSTLSTPLRSETDAVAAAAQQHPTLLEYFVKWNQYFGPATVQQCYQQGALPVLTWDPSDGSSAVNQPQFSLAKIANGSFDPYLVQFATAVRNQKWPVVIRFAQEMNGSWSPWAGTNSGNKPGDFVKAWRHIHDVFSVVGATNVIWLWSPNVLRGTGGTSLAQLYPGDAYVDWVGIDAYGFGEKTASQILDPTVAAVHKLTQKPILLAETGSRPGPQQPGWTADLFAWLRRNQEAIGFIWFQHSVAEGGHYDYRFTTDPETLHVFQAGLRSLDLHGWPVTTRPSPAPGSP
jgi:Glycosyl hydrolase family 26